MKYICYTLSMPESEAVKDMLMSLLADSGFESFMDDENGLNAYCPISEHHPDEVNQILNMEQFSKLKVLKFEEIPDQDWNAAWESSYSPVVLGPRCRVRAPFHEADSSFEFDLLINPKMSFGTAHHETTSQIIELMLETDFKGVDVLDMGSGTAILAILAKKLGAAKTVAIDNDEWAYNNALENINLNNTNDIQVELGDARAIGNRRFGIILANINRNILLRDMNFYVRALHTDGLIFFSGFYFEDLKLIQEQAEDLGLTYVRHLQKNNWVAAIFKKL